MIARVVIYLVCVVVLGAVIRRESDRAGAADDELTRRRNDWGHWP